MNWINQNQMRKLLLSHIIYLIHEKYLKLGSINKIFYTNYEDLFYKYNIHTWICGHSHSKMIKTINNTKVILNPFGYKNENKINSFLEIEL